MQLQAASARKLFSAVEGCACSFLFDALCTGRPQAGDESQAKAHGRLAWKVFQGAVDIAVHYVDRAHFNAVAAGVLNQLARGVEAERLAVEERGQEGRWLMALDPRRSVDEKCKARCMRLREPVLAESFDLLKDGLGKAAFVASLQHSVDDFVVVLFESALALPRGHSASQAVRFAGRPLRRP